MSPTPAPSQLTEAEIGAFRVEPVDRTRLARYLELPGPQEIDPVTRGEIDRLDGMRDTLVGFWSHAVAVPIERIDGRWIELEGGTRLRPGWSYGRQLQAARADWLIVTAFTVGAAIDTKVRRHLADGELFEAFVLNQWAAVMTEQARASLTRSLRGWAQHHGRSLLPYHGPGYNGWPLEDMAVLLRLLADAGDDDSPFALQPAESGLLQPTHSMVIVHGATPRRLPAPRDEALAQCHRCAMRHCRYRIAPLDRSSARGIPELVTEPIA